MKLIVIKEDMKRNIRSEITFREAYCDLLNSDHNRLTPIALNYILLSNTKIVDEICTYQRKL